MNTIYKTMVLKTLDIRQWKTAMSEKLEKNEVSPTTAPSLPSGESFRLWQKMKEPSQNSRMELRLQESQGD